MQYCNSAFLVRDNIKKHEKGVHLLRRARTRKDVRRIPKKNNLSVSDGTLYSTNEIVLSISKLYYVPNRYFFPQGN
jgi:hypothetical protein